MGKQWSRWSSLCILYLSFLLSPLFWEERTFKLNIADLGDSLCRDCLQQEDLCQTLWTFLLLIREAGYGKKPYDLYTLQMSWVEKSSRSKLHKSSDLLSLTFFCSFCSMGNKSFSNISVLDLSNTIIPSCVRCTFRHITLTEGIPSGKFKFHYHCIFTLLLGPPMIQREHFGSTIKQTVWHMWSMSVS